MSYNVYKVAYLGAPRNHHGVFIETHSSGDGSLIHVIGDIQSGMVFEQKEAKKPEDSATFVERTFLGTISTSDYQRVVETCRKIPPPKKQFNGGKRLYKKEPLRRCQEWTDEAVQALFSRGLLQDRASTASSIATASKYWEWSEVYKKWYHDNGDGTFEWSESSAASGAEDKGKGKGRGS